MALPLQYDFYNKIITVPAPDTTLDLQYLVNETRYAEETLNPGIQYNKIIDAYGKQDLGGGVKVGITVVMLDGWRVAFEARSGPDTVSVTISGGNFVGEAGANPVCPTAFTQVTIAQSTSASISSSSVDTNLVYLIESLRSVHPATGTIYYWDPYGGNDANTGTSPSASVLTFAKAQELASAGKNDLIFCRSTNPAGVTTVTEALNITKNNLKVRGPGNTVKLIPTSTSAPTVTISASNIELSGFYLETAGTGGQNAITMTGDNNLLRDLWISSTQNHGLSVNSSARFRLLTSVLENCAGDSLHLSTATTQALVSKCILSGSANGIVLTGTGIADNIIENCLVYKHSGYGVSIASGVARTTLRGGNTITNNTSGNTQDNGTDTYIESPAGGASTTDIADAVWDEVISSHTGAGTVGRTLKDIKTRATLASLK